jgi:hypothetical protein
MSIELPDLKKIVESNPQLDLAKVKEALDLFAELQRFGVRPATYKLRSPWERHRKRIDSRKPLL